MRPDHRFNLETSARLFQLFTTSYHFVQNQLIRDHRIVIGFRGILKISARLLQKIR